jgi:hypothetical protein
VSVNKVFPESFNFILVKGLIPMFDLIDINENVYNKSVVFHPDEIRSFIFILVPKINE